MFDRLKSIFVAKVVGWYGKPVVANCHITAGVKIDTPGTVLVNNVLIREKSIGENFYGIIAEDLTKFNKPAFNKQPGGALQ